MTKSPDKAFDLTAVVDQLDPTRDKNLIRAIKVFHAVESVGLDLRDAAESVKILHGIGRENSETASRVGSALLVHAVIIYSRATHTRAVQRFNVGVTRAYDRALKAKHAEIIDLRDKCMAHFGPGKDLWHDERVVYVERASGNGVFLVHRRTNFSLKAIEDLGDLLAAAIPYVKWLEKDRAIELGSKLTEADKLASAIIDGHEFDIEAFFKTNELKSRVREEAAFSQDLWEAERRMWDGKR
ncbi:hypothetical protein AB4Z43_02405 [Mesorhizobium sp. 2RAF45]|uniref:hypothetical protein n=1 Tax=Mesorhizobium sp. 2RAF45 TaxID=3233001 RepID=UPI003F9553C7